MAAETVIFPGGRTMIALNGPHQRFTSEYSKKSPPGLAGILCRAARRAKNLTEGSGGLRGDGNPSMGPNGRNLRMKSDRLGSAHCAVERRDKFSVKI